MLFLMFNMCCVGCGTRKPACRVTGAICGFILGLFNLAMIVTTAVYRFSAIGMLCSLDVTPTNSPSSDFMDVDDTWTYQKDGNLLLAIWIFQVLGFMICVCVSMAPIMNSESTNSITRL